MTALELTTVQRIGATATARQDSKVVIGPWNHGGFGKSELGEFNFGVGAGLDHHQEIIRWFDFWLKGRDTGVDVLPPVRYFVMDSGKWKNAESWPPGGYQAVKFCLDAEAGKGGQDLALRPVQPPQDQSEVSYTYKPARSRPYPVESDAVFGAWQPPAPGLPPGHPALPLSAADRVAGNRG